MIAMRFQSGQQLMNTLDGIQEDLIYLLPELALVIGILLLLAFDLIFDGKKSIGLATIAFATVFFTACCLYFSFPYQQQPIQLMNGLLQSSPQTAFLKLIFVVSGIVILFMATRSSDFKKLFFRSSEVPIAIVGLLLGVFLMTMSIHWLMVYISIELVSISSYLLVGLSPGKKNAEAGMKYLLYGASASAVMLFGMSWLYGLTGTLHFYSDTFLAGIQAADPLVTSAAFILLLFGILFKLGAFPMHAWSPDVYEAAPIPIVSLFAVIPKVAALFLLWQISAIAIDLTGGWEQWVAVLAIGGMVLGNFGAIWQRNAKRMLAYSSIAHAAFLLSALLLGEMAYQVLFFYVVVYALMTLAAFFLVQIFEQRLNAVRFDSFHGLGKSSPYLSILLLVVMLALIGLPPTAGFNAKFYLFAGLWNTYESSGQEVVLWVLISGVANTVVALFYYMKLPYLLFFKHTSFELTKEMRENVNRDCLFGTLIVIPLLLIFFRSDALVDLLNNVNFTF